MARVVTYSVSPRINPSEKGTPPKYYGHVQARGDVSLREMSERIQQTCTVHKSDVYAVLVALEDVITDALRGGEIVRLGDLGTLQIGISSKGALTEEDYEESMITSSSATSTAYTSDLVTVHDAWMRSAISRMLTSPFACTCP